MSSAGSEITRRAKISDYLSARGVELRRSGSRQVCLCPLHDEDTPSFNVGNFPDGGQWFYCFGCGERGSIIRLKALLEGIDTKQSFAALAQGLDIDTTSEQFARHVEPLPEDIMRNFGAAEILGMDIANYVKGYMRAQRNSADVVDRCCRLYKRMDAMIQDQDIAGLIRLREQAAELLVEEGAHRRRRQAELLVPEETPVMVAAVEVPTPVPSATPARRILPPRYICPPDETPNTTEIFRTPENHDLLDDYEYLEALDALPFPDDGWDL